MKPDAINENLSIYQNPGSLAFGTDAYLLAAYLRCRPKTRACELGAGSGVISLLATARQKYAHITAIELQASIAALAEQNVEKNGFSGQIDVMCADVRTLPPSLHDTFGAVFANPPYMSADCGKLGENEADRISRHELFGTVADFAAAASSLLQYGGTFTVVYRPDRMATLFAACKENHLEPKRMTLVYPTAAHAPCLLLLEAKKNGAPGLYTTPPLLIYKAGMAQTNENYTDEMKYIYENGAFHEQYQKP